jgi:hypothetical protein
MQLLSLLYKYQHLFDGSLGTWNANPYNIELKPDAKPYHSRPFPVPNAHQARFHSSPINCSPNLVLKLAKFRSSKLIQIHPNHQIWLFGYSVIWIFGYSGHPNNWIFGYLGVQGDPNNWIFGYLVIRITQRKLKKPNLAINLEVR